ncbi:hypothetical protein GCM10010435_08610 [Winogradskya consettensis]|uniref:Uncharacterized protein n=1 Tax=Winogradskya consettensis TaxID=113560 RepID=A0A919T058_9ACTN|nr:hypothetical protein [Actinoplanes consettensis]GIM80552.1 hypothetical protein Aco04nite_71330 [Actinoplanes consettensis]
MDSFTPVEETLRSRRVDFENFYANNYGITRAILDIHLTPADVASVTTAILSSPERISGPGRR